MWGKRMDGKAPRPAGPEGVGSSVLRTGVHLLVYHVTACSARNRGLSFRWLGAVCINAITAWQSMQACIRPPNEPSG